MKIVINKMTVYVTSCLLLAFSCNAADKDTQDPLEDLLLFLADEESVDDNWYNALDFEEDITSKIDEPNTNTLSQINPEENN